MLIKRTASGLFAWAILVLLSARALAQPASANLDYQSPTPSYSNASAPYSNSNPSSGHSLWPFKPGGVEPKLDAFGPAETSGYGNGPRPKIGWFGSFERVLWLLSKPTTAEIGSPTATGPAISPLGSPTILDNSADTGFLLANPAWGNRIELGYMDTNNYGWMVSVLDHVSQGQYHIIQNAQVQFNDPANLLSGFLPFIDPVTGAIIDADTNGNNIYGRDGEDVGRPNPNQPPPEFVPPPDGHPDTPAPTDFGDVVQFPVTFRTMNVKQVTRLNGVELMRMYRAPKLHNGGYFELLYGVRYFQLDDAFGVQGLSSGSGVTGTGVNLSNPLSNSSWYTRAQSNLIGPQIGGRWFRQQEHWIFSCELRFLAAANLQNVHQKTSMADQSALINPTLNPSTGVVNPGVPLNLLSGFGTDTHAFATTFAPLGEIRVQTTYQATKSVGLKFGYTGIIVGNVTRASNRIDYSGPQLISILPGGIHQTFFSNGLNFGIEVNR